MFTVYYCLRSLDPDFIPDLEVESYEIEISRKIGIVCFDSAVVAFCVVCVLNILGSNKL